MKFALKLALVGCLFSQAAFAEKSIVISESASYYDEKIIPPNIRQECVELGTQFSDSTQKFLTAKGWQAEQAADLPESGLSLELTIVNAMSSGNAWSGHKKSVSMEAKLMKNGEVIDTFERQRDSNGGFGAGFKGSCAVLQRCVNALGKDVAKWMSKKKDI